MGGECTPKLHHPVLNRAIFADEYGQGPSLPQIDEAELRELGFPGGHHHHAGSPRNVRQDCAGLLQGLFDRAGV